MVIIPVFAEPLFSQVTTLSGTDYALTFAWNLRESKWYMDIADQDGNVLAGSLKVTVNYPMLRRSTNPLLPAGVIIPIDSSGSGEDPGLGDFGTRVLMVYFEPGDLP